MDDGGPETLCARAHRGCKNVVPSSQAAVYRCFYAKMSSQSRPNGLFTEVFVVPNAPHAVEEPYLPSDHDRLKPARDDGWWMIGNKRKRESAPMCKLGVPVAPSPRLPRFFEFLVVPEAYRSRAAPVFTEVLGVPPGVFDF